MTPNAPPILEFRRISRGFFGVPVLRDIDLPVRAGRILGLVGENGAGKSTLMNVLGGVLTPDSGTMLLGGGPYAPRTPRDAAGAGIAFIHQELNLFANLTVAENLHVEAFPRRRLGRLKLPLLDHGAVRDRARRLLAEVDLRCDPGDVVESLSPGERQLVEIAKAIGADARLIILDEPTTSLTAPEAERLFSLMDRLRSRGVSMVYVSHNLPDVLRLCDDVAVLRDGRVISHGPRSGYDAGRLVTEMVGRDVEQRPATAQRGVHSEPALEARGISRTGVLRDIDLSLHRGEILGVAGLMGAGRTELARALFGLDPIDAGRLRLLGRDFTPTPRQSIRRGMAFLTENRREEGLMMEATVLENAALVRLPALARTFLSIVSGRRVREEVNEHAGSVRLSAAAVERHVARTLSGGNQQKVVLAKWLMNNPKVLILDEPTRGIDVGARQEVYGIIESLAARGTAVLLISSEIEELMALCDRILVMAGGRIRDSLERPQFDRERILRSALDAARSNEARP